MEIKRKWIALSKWFSTRPYITGIFVFVLLLILVGFVLNLRYKIVEENRRREMSNIINVVHQNFEQVLKNSYTTTITLAMSINDKGVPADFYKIAPQLIKSNDCIDAVQMVPDGIIKYIYPIKGNEAAVGFDILHSSNLRQGAIKSIETKLIYFAGPLELRQGGMGVVGRLPIFKENKFWGFSAVMIRMKTLLKSTGIAAIDDSKYYFQFSKINPYTGKEEFFLSNKEDFSEKYYQTVTIPDGDWKLYLIVRDKNALLKQLTTSSIFGFLFSLICGLWVVSILKKPAELELKILQQTQKIMQREQEFKTLFDQAPVGIVRLETNTGKFIDVNDAFCKIVGYSESELKELNFQKITHEDDIENDLKNIALIKKGDLNSLEVTKRYIHKTGRTVWVTLIVSKIWKKEKNVVNHITIVEDITERKRAEEELKQSFEVVSEQNKRLLNFSYIVSHNLRSHTSNIQSISSFLEIAETKKERDDMIDLLKQVSHSLNETMSNLNEVVSIRTNINLTVEQLNLHDYIENAKVVLSKQMQSKFAKVQNLVTPGIEVLYNAAYLESILLNFISNAVRYSHPDRKPMIKISYDEQLKTLTIADNGIGIDLEKNGTKLFGMYKTFNNNPDSKGIGLFITKNQIDAMGGRIETESKLGVGTTFTIYFK
jgi:PAS domain S-box-containing protein